MINQNGPKLFFLRVLTYALAAAAVLFGYFIVMMTVFSLAGTSYGSMAYVLLFSVLFILLGLCFEPLERLMVHSFTFFRTGRLPFLLLASTVQLLFLWMTAYTTDKLIEKIWLSTTEELIVAGVFFVLDKCVSVQKQTRSQ
ncbi:YrvL family regulatory protein [Bacillus amyloliquefaciens]|uniref:YrvL family regulatory protein n=1 Tax=Bacillus amyloliquefaciens TaxID=1390 RepID=UPI0022B03F37|nr:YrvL family regulatory protein [Bacillus amyloliquefaciens]MCZ4248089.1 YrvL family regulatory protein [Bacillus amyloliquefaciens]